MWCVCVCACVRGVSLVRVRAWAGTRQGAFGRSLTEKAYHRKGGGSPPFAGDNDKEILAKIKKGSFTMEGRRYACMSKDNQCVVHLNIAIAERFGAATFGTTPWTSHQVAALRSAAIAWLAPSEMGSCYDWAATVKPAAK